MRYLCLTPRWLFLRGLSERVSMLVPLSAQTTVLGAVCYAQITEFPPNQPRDGILISWVLRCPSKGLPELKLGMQGTCVFS